MNLEFTKAKALYRPDIDGLRAIAVLLVIAFHFFPDLITGGFIGVDIFFPISGFLISGILFRELRHGNFSFLRFYDRRIRRIFPSLITILVFSLIVGQLFFTATEEQSLSKSVIGGAGFIANFIFWKDFGYFHSSAEYKPLLHLWSLGVEEQFYILWPLILCLSWRFFKNVIVLVSLLLAASFILNVLIIGHYPEADFYLLPTRLWELAVGGLASYFVLFKGEDKLFGSSRTKLASNICSLLGAILIYLGARFIDKTAAFPGWWALLPVLGTVFLIVAGPKAIINYKILSNPVLTFVGIISYPLYLWHWPLLSFDRVLGLGEPSSLVKIALIASSIAMAWVTYKFIETPIRTSQSNQQFTKPSFALVTSMCCVGIVSLAVNTHLIQPSQFQKISKKFEFGIDPESLELTSEYNKLFREECNYSYRTTRSQQLDVSCYQPKYKKTVFIWGDSHAQHLNAGLSSYFHNDKVSLLQLASSSCPPQFASMTNSLCDRANQMALDKITELKPDVVILSEQGVFLDLKRLNKAIEIMRKSGVRNIVMVGPNPEWRPDLYKIILRKYLFFGKEIPERLSFGVWDQSFLIDKVLRTEFTDQRKVRYLSLIDHLCDQNGCLTKVGNKMPNDLLLFDKNHFSENASKMIANQIIGPVVRKMLKLKN